MCKLTDSTLIGIDSNKPDRHLQRLAHEFGYDDVHRMCQDIRAEVGDRISVTDIVLWRFAERAKSGLLDGL